MPVYRNVYDRCGRWIGRRLIGWNVAVYDYCGRLVGWRFVPCY